ncbi:uncharacterized PE-PGRS family protein PE_PGRS54-like [Dermacentor silvarum]|uniref:uncharacterized PE-PGRS family protein PE_PGRS54-like n=1 Tax=Dermacentor silvarum TaxID=543639 RepID=UPI002101994D|nr:uncharacterized PE-PGRS family protein PE_PGRS54-like [Dermacentor silvarum]
MYTTSRFLSFLMLKIATILRFLTVLFFIQGTVCQNEAVYRRKRYCRRLFTPAINSAIGVCTFPCLLLSREEPPKILVQWEPDGSLCKIYERFSQKLKTGHCRRGLCLGTPSYGGIQRIKRDLRSSITSRQRNNSYAVYTHLNRTAGAASAATLRQRIERRRRQMWFDCECASQKGLFGDMSSSSRSFGRGSRGRRGKRRKVGCRIICMFLVNRYKHDKSWASLFEARSNSFGSGGIANAAATSIGNGSFHELTGGLTGGPTSRLNASGISSTSHVSGMHGAGMIGSGGVRITNHLAAGSGGVSVNNAPTSDRGTGAGAGAAGGSGTIVGIGTANGAASRTVLAGTSVGSVSTTLSSVPIVGSEGNKPVGGDANGRPASVSGRPPVSSMNTINNSGTSGVGVGGIPGTRSTGNVAIAGGSSTIAGINSAATGGAPSSVAAGGLSGSSTAGATGSTSNNRNTLGSTGLSGNNIDVRGGASVESGGGVSSGAVGVVSSGSGRVVNSDSLTGSRLGIDNGGLTTETVRNHGSNTVTGSESSSVTAGGTGSTNNAGHGVGSSGSRMGVAVSGGPAFPGSEGAMNAIARGGGTGIHAVVGSNGRGIGNGGMPNVHGDERGTSASGWTPNVIGMGGSATLHGSSTGNTGMTSISTTSLTAGSPVSATTTIESRPGFTIGSAGGASGGVTGSLGAGGRSNGAAVSSTGMNTGTTGSGTVLSGISGASNSTSSSTALIEGTGAGGNDTGIGVHGVGSGPIRTGTNGFSRESGVPPNSGTVVVGGTAGAVPSSVDSNRVLGTGTSAASSIAGVLSGGITSGSILTPGNTASPTGTSTPSVVTGNGSPGSEAVGIASVGNRGNGIMNTGLPERSTSIPVRNSVGNGAGPSNVGVGGGGNDTSHVTTTSGVMSGSTGEGATSAVTGHASGASERIRIGSVGNPGSEIGNSGSSGGSVTVRLTTGSESGAGHGNTAMSSTGGRNHVPAPTGTAGSSGFGAVTGGISNGSAGSPGVTALAGGGASSALTGYEGVGAGSSSNRGIAAPTNRSDSGGANSAGFAGAGGTATENEVGGGGSSMLGMASSGVSGLSTRLPNLRVSGGSETVRGIGSNSGVEIGTVSVRTSNANAITPCLAPTLFLLALITLWLSEGRTALPLVPRAAVAA